MARKRMRKRRRALSLITGHLGGIKRALLEGEKRPAFLEFLESELHAKRGIYALYKRGRLYYAGKASDLAKRLNQHLRDRHGESWDGMTLFLVADSANVSELEGLVVATAQPQGNKQKPKLGQDLRRRLRRYLRQDAHEQIDQAVYPEKRQRKLDALARRLSTKKMKAVGQARLARVLGISQPRVSQLLARGAIRKYILEAGKRDAVLLLLQKAKRQ
jgi:predicted XRE-type DNA-binding protein